MSAEKYAPVSSFMFKFIPGEKKGSKEKVVFKGMKFGFQSSAFEPSFNTNIVKYYCVNMRNGGCNMSIKHDVDNDLFYVLRGGSHSCIQPPPQPDRRSEPSVNVTSPIQPFASRSGVDSRMKSGNTTGEGMNLETYQNPECSPITNWVNVIEISPEQVVKNNPYLTAKVTISPLFIELIGMPVFTVSVQDENNERMFAEVHFLDKPGVNFRILILVPGSLACGKNTLFITFSLPQGRIRMDQSIGSSIFESHVNFQFPFTLLSTSQKRIKEHDNPEDQKKPRTFLNIDHTRTEIQCLLPNHGPLEGRNHCDVCFSVSDFDRYNRLTGTFKDPTISFGEKIGVFAGLTRFDMNQRHDVMETVRREQPMNEGSVIGRTQFVAVVKVPNSETPGSVHVKLHAHIYVTVLENGYTYVNETSNFEPQNTSSFTNEVDEFGLGKIDNWDIDDNKIIGQKQKQFVYDGDMSSEEEEEEEDWRKCKDGDVDGFLSNRLFYAVAQDDLEMVKHFVEVMDFNIMRKNIFGLTVFDVAKYFLRNRILTYFHYQISSQPIMSRGIKPSTKGGDGVDATQKRKLELLQFKVKLLEESESSYKDSIRSMKEEHDSEMKKMSEEHDQKIESLKEEHTTTLKSKVQGDEEVQKLRNQVTSLLKLKLKEGEASNEIKKLKNTVKNLKVKNKKLTKKIAVLEQFSEEQKMRIQKQQRSGRTGSIIPVSSSPVLQDDSSFRGYDNDMNDQPRVEFMSKRIKESTNNIKVMKLGCSSDEIERMKKRREGKKKNIKQGMKRGRQGKKKKKKRKLKIVCPSCDQVCDSAGKHIRVDLKKGTLTHKCKAISRKMNFNNKPLKDIKLRHYIKLTKGRQRCGIISHSVFRNGVGNCDGCKKDVTATEIQLRRKNFYVFGT